MNDEKYISWEELNRGCLSLVMNNVLTFDNSEVVVALSEDTIPASIISILVGLPLIVINRSELYNTSRNNIPDISYPIFSGIGTLPSLPKLLMVSSAIFMDTTINDIVDTYKERGHEIINMTLFYGDDCGITPDCYWQRSDCGTKLIFPWEV